MIESYIWATRQMQHLNVGMFRTNDKFTTLDVGWLNTWDEICSCIAVVYVAFVTLQLALSKQKIAEAQTSTDDARLMVCRLWNVDL